MRTYVSLSAEIGERRLEVVTRKRTGEKHWVWTKKENLPILTSVFDSSYVVVFCTCCGSSRGWNELDLYAEILAGSTGLGPKVDNEL